MNQAWTKLKLIRSVPIAILVAVALFVGATQGRTLWNEFYYNFFNRECFSDSAPCGDPSKFISWWTAKAFENQQPNFQKCHTNATFYASPEVVKLMHQTFWQNTKKTLPVDVVMPQSYFADYSNEPNSMEEVRVLVDLSKPEMPHLYVRMRFDLEEIAGMYKVRHLVLKDGAKEKIQQFLANVDPNPAPNLVKRNAQATRQLRRGPIWGHGQFSKIAEEEIREALAINPNFALANIELGRIASFAGEYDKAVEHFQNAIACDPDFVLGYLELGETYLKMRNEGFALSAFTQATQADPMFAIAFGKRAYIENLLHKDECAIADLSHAILLDPAYSVAYVNRGIYHYFADRDKAALDDLNNAIALYSDKADWYNVRAKIECSLKDWKSALRDTHKAIEMEPENADFYCTRSWAKIIAKCPNSALSDANRAISLNPKMGYAYRRRACAKVDLKDLTGALEDLKNAVQLEPSDRYNMMGLEDVQAMLAKK
ncbi:MAG: tetratricopeptide repeat protein [Candidatus Melainabacteria bacterium]|nr:tetratricopeptide repeat protein [Candidatus Melainabacteria bacterium]